jgi:excinuclease UvrABC ATPase subunit
MEQEYIEIRGARENNLKDVNLKIPKRKITIFTGVSGSGKSSLVFDTIAAESQRLLNENFSMFVRNFLPKITQPDADEIKNLSMAVIVDQKPLGGGSHSTVGTVTDIAAVLRLMFSRFGKPYVGYANMFSFNDASGRCPSCNGIGQKLSLNMDAAFDMNLSINEGAIKLPDYANDGWYLKLVKASKLFDNDKKLKDFSKKELDDLFHSKPFKVDMGGGVKMNFEGVVDKFVHKYIDYDLKTYSQRTQNAVLPFVTMGQCDLCHGARLNQKALACKIDGYNIADLSALQVDKLFDLVKKFENSENKALIGTLHER